MQAGVGAPVVQQLPRLRNVELVQVPVGGQRPEQAADLVRALREPEDVPGLEAGARVEGDLLLSIATARTSSELIASGSCAGAPKRSNCAP
jgi:hypothetical protein